MSAAFSWADTLHIAVNSCLPCLRPTESTDSLNSPHPPSHHVQRARPDELRGLLAESTDAEALSLHTNPGITQRVKKKKRPAFDPQRRITLFGYNLFGHPNPQPIRLPDDDDAIYHTAPPLTTPTLTTQSTATFDSDATPLDATTISNLSGSAAAALAEAEEEERKQREERRRQRRERRELKKVARALALSGNSEFEGFQGSGDGYPGIPSSYLREYQAQVQPLQPPPSSTTFLPHLTPKEDEDDEHADLGGVVYTRRRAPGNGSNDGSDSRSRTSASTRDRPNPPAPHQLSSHCQAKESRSKSKPNSSLTFTKSTASNSVSSNNSTSYHRSKSSRSSHTNADSPSIASPVSPSFPPATQDRVGAGMTAVLSPSTIEQGQGFFDLENEPQVRVPAVHHAKSPNEAVPALERGTFPSAGLGVGFGFTGRARGAFLANTIPPADRKLPRGDDF